jgi:chemosensory pili system protein ChpA (sensor histidine kinase/response regulator)
VPIIMITSRVGDKHRARAIEIGVNDYLGKPYQDSQLLDAIRRLLEERGILLQ